MNNHVKKMIAPILISAIIVFYYIYFGYIIYTIGGISLPVKLLGLGIPLVIIGASIFVLRERINEIRRGEEDDLSKY